MKIASKQTRWIYIIILVFFTIYSSISLVNHYMFRTYALDLGMYNQAIRNAASFQTPMFTLSHVGEEMPFLATHFSPVIFLFTPLYYIFGNYTLLLAQIAAILFGGFGAYLYAKHRMGGDSLTPLLALAHFLSIWGIYSALTYDFHCNVIGAMLVPWFFLFYEQKKYNQALIIMLLAFLSMETMPIWFAFIIIALTLTKFSLKEFLKVDLPLIALCVVAGIGIVFILMPWLQGNTSNLQLTRYLYLGNSPLQAIANLITSPDLLFKTLFTNTIGEPAYDYIKLEFHLMVLISGGLLFLLNPRFIVMLIPIYLQKLIPNDYNFWGINNQYSIEFVPILSISAITFLSGIRPKLRPYIAMAITALALGATLYTMENRVSKWYDGVNTRFYSKRHYHTEFDVKKINRAIRVAHASRAVSASSRLAPHITSQRIYHYPIVKDAEYILVLPNSNTWPLSYDDFQHSIDTLKQSESFSTIYSDKDLLIFKRK